MNLSQEFKQNVRAAILHHRQNFGGTDTDYARTLGIKPSIYSRLKKGETEGLLSNTIWITIGRELDVRMHQSTWKVARTKVYNEIEESLNEPESCTMKLHRGKIVLIPHTASRINQPLNGYAFTELRLFDYNLDAIPFASVSLFWNSGIKFRVPERK